METEINEENPESENKARWKKILLYMFLFLCFSWAAFVKQFSLFLPYTWTIVSVFMLISFGGTIGLLLDAAWRLKPSPWAILPVLVSALVLGDMFYNAQLHGLEFYSYILGSLLYPVFGLLTVLTSFKAWIRGYKFLFLLLLLLGLSSFTLLWYPYIEFFSVLYNSSNVFIRVSFLTTFALVLLVDIFGKLEQKGFRIEAKIMQNALLVISVLYFVRFIFK
jgi:hypothetical protein